MGPEPTIGRRKKKPADEEPEESLFDNLPEAKPKVKDEFAEKDKKPKEEEKIVITPAKLPVEPEESSSEEEEEEPKPEPKKKLSRSDLKPAVQIKVAAAPEPVIGRRKKKEPEEQPEESLFDNLPKAKPKIADEFAEKEKKPKEEEKVVITPKDLPVKPAVQIKVAAAPEPAIGRRKKKPADEEPEESLFDNLPESKPKIKDEFAEKDKKPKEEEKIVITPAKLPVKPEESC